MGFQRQHLCSVFILILIGHVVAANENGINNSKQALDLLEKAYLAATQYPPVAYDGENKSAEMRFSVKYYQRGNEIDIFKIRYDMIGGEEKAVIRSRAVGDGKRLIHYDTAEIEGPLERGKLGAYFTNDETRLTILLTRRSMCAHLDGWASFDNEHLSESMKNADRLVLLDEMERVGDSACHVLESFGPRGHHKVWIDPEHGYHIRKAVIEKKADDLYGTRTVTDARQSSFKTLIEIVNFQNIDGVWFPVEGTEDRTWGSLNEDGTETFRNVRSTAKRSNIRFNPNFEELGAFVMDIPDGNWIRNLEFPAAQYVWRNGQIIPYIERYSLEIIEQEMDKMQSKRSTGQAIAPNTPMETVNIDQEPNDIDTPEEPAEPAPIGTSTIGRTGFVTILICSLIVLSVTGAMSLHYVRRKK